jgi:hypothetical protein
LNTKTLRELLEKKITPKAWSKISEDIDKIIDVIDEKDPLSNEDAIMNVIEACEQGKIVDIIRTTVVGTNL